MLEMTVKYLRSLKRKERFHTGLYPSVYENTNLIHFLYHLHQHINTKNLFEFNCETEGTVL